MSYYQRSNFFGSFPVVTRNLLIINTIIWAACNLIGSLVNYLALYHILSPQFKLYQIVTYMFTHYEFNHLFFNMFALFMFGSTIENYWGHKRYLIYYMVTGVGAGLIQLLVMYITGVNAPTIGASGAVFGLLLAFGMLFPNTPLYLMFIPIPIKAKYMVIGYGLIEFFFGVSQFRGDNVAHYAHLGGMLFGIVLILYWNHDSYFAKLFNRFKTFFKRKPKIDASRRGFGFESDWNYNARKAAKSKEIDTILDKIKHSGYNSLTEEEKRKLFEQSKKE